jgi:hypothetical protein
MGSPQQAVYQLAQHPQAGNRAAWEAELMVGGYQRTIFQENDRGDGARGIERRSGGRRGREAGARGLGNGCRDVLELCG